MSRHLLILRHAKSDWNTGSATDFERPLAKRGLRDAPRMGAWMKRHGLTPDHIVSSPAKRTKETTLLICETIGLAPSGINWDERIYEASLGNLLDVISEQPQAANSVLLVGHNPGMDDLVRYLWGNKTELPSDGNLMPTATLAYLSLPDDWSDLQPGCGELLSITRPKEIDSV